MTEIQITEIQRLKIEPGDRLIVRLHEGVYSDQEAVNATRVIRARLQLADDTPVLILGRDDTIEVAKADGRTLEQVIDDRIRTHVRMSRPGRTSY